MNTHKIIQGDCIAGMRTLPDGCIQTCITSPPYFALRDYSGGEEEIGQEDTVEGYVQKMVEVFREVRRILRPDGTVWLNLGDSYMSAKGCSPPPQTLGKGAADGQPKDFVTKKATNVARITMLLKSNRMWSGRQDSNLRRTAWKADTLPLSYARIYLWSR